MSRSFDPSKYETTSKPLATETSSRRDPFFEKYTYDVYQSMSQNPSELFNFFFENNDILKKISQEDERTLYLRFKERQEKVFYSAMGTAVAIFIADKFIAPKLFPTRPLRMERFRILAFGAKYILCPLIAYKAMDNYLNLEDEFMNCALKYNFNYDDFSQAMGVFERAKLLGCLDDLLKQRADFDFRRLEAVPDENQYTFGGDILAEKPTRNPNLLK